MKIEGKTFAETEGREKFPNDPHSKGVRARLQRRVERKSRLYKDFPYELHQLRELAKQIEHPWESELKNLVSKIQDVRSAARKRGDYATADQLRAVLQNSGIQVNDGPPQ